MGKTGKKSKSDKIFALRKQYDAFLEEDKKRKDRNEYILGRMETMRSCTNLVHVRSTGYPKTEESDYPTKYKTMAHISNSAVALSGRSHETTKYSNENYDEPSLLREISKKYFLIPKVISNLKIVNYKENEQDPVSSGDTDWKNKYNILDELKREEEEHSKTLYEKQNTNMDDPYDNNKNCEYIPKDSNKMSILQYQSNLELTPIKQETDICVKPNKEISFNNLEVEPNQNKVEQIDKTLNGENIGITKSNIEKQELNSQLNALHKVNLPEHSTPRKVYQAENNITTDTMLNSTKKIHEIKESNDLHDKKPTSNKEPIEGLVESKYLPKEKNCFEIVDPQDNTSNNTLNTANKNNSPVINNVNTMEVKNENKAYKDIQDENTVKAQGDYERVASHFKNNIEHQEYHSQESDTNEIQNVEQTITTEVNDELETEQKEMFYGDESDKNKEYSENDDTTTYQAESENYINQEYSYYNESQNEQLYQTEINEHEETTERYDPNYEQQYVNNYDDTMNTHYQPEQYNVENSYDQQQNMYDQSDSVNYTENANYEHAPIENVQGAEPNQNIYYTNVPQENAQYEAEQIENSEMVEQPNTAYTTSEEYDTQQEYLEMHAEALPIENVEQELDVEDGYIPNCNIGAENLDYQEHLEERTPEIQQTDVNVK